MRRITLNIALICFLVLGSITSYSQRAGNKMEIKKTEIEARLTTQLELTESEQSLFFPMLASYKKDVREINKKYRALRPKNKKIQDLNDAEIEEFLDNTVAQKQELMDLRSVYHEKFKGVLPIKKLAKYYIISQKRKK